jgi:hypothetical protein
MLYICSHRSGGGGAAEQYAAAVIVSLHGGLLTLLLPQPHSYVRADLHSEFCALRRQSRPQSLDPPKQFTMRARVGALWVLLTLSVARASEMEVRDAGERRALCRRRRRRCSSGFIGGRVRTGVSPSITTTPPYAFLTTASNCLSAGCAVPFHGQRDLPVRS